MLLEAFLVGSHQFSQQHGLPFVSTWRHQSSVTSLTYPRPLFDVVLIWRHCGDNVTHHTAMTAAMTWNDGRSHPHCWQLTVDCTTAHHWSHDRSPLTACFAMTINKVQGQIFKCIVQVSICKRQFSYMRCCTLHCLQTNVPGTLCTRRFCENCSGW
jgi:hypothetical protein